MSTTVPSSKVKTKIISGRVCFNLVYKTIHQFQPYYTEIYENIVHNTLRKVKEIGK